MHTNWKYKAYPQKSVEKLAARIRTEWLAFKDREKSTQTEFAARLGVSQPALNQFLNGTTPISNAMIIQICGELGVDPKRLVKGIKFFEPFFDNIISTNIVRIRYRIGAKISRSKAVTGEVVHYHAQLSKDVDIYALDIDDGVYEPRYYKGEKVIVAAVEPQPGDECFLMAKDGRASIVRYQIDGTLLCMKNVGKCFNGEAVTPEEIAEDTEFLHKVIGMSR